MRLKIFRNGQMRDVDVTLGELSQTTDISAAGKSGRAALQGVQVQNLTPVIARQLGVSATAMGIVVTSVDPSSAAAAADLERGDVIQEVNRKPVRDVADYDRALARTDNQTILLLVDRAGSADFIVVSPQ